ncbi:MAG: caspase domain-containing protein [Bacteroidia bacterium]
MNKRYLLFVWVLLNIFTSKAQLEEIKLMLPREIGFNYYEFIEFLPGDKQVVVLANSLSVYDTETSEILDEYPLPIGAKNLAINPKGDQICITVNNKLMIFSFNGKHLLLKQTIESSALLKDFENGQIYSSVPIGACFYVSDTKVYSAIGSFVVIYDIENSVVTDKHAFDLGNYVWGASHYKLGNAVILAHMTGTLSAVKKQSLNSLSDIQTILEQKATVLKTRVRDHKLICFTSDKYFVMDLSSGKMDLEIRMPKIKQNELFKIDEKFLKESNKRPAISVPDTVNFSEGEYIYDMDYHKNSSSLFICSTKGMKVYNLLNRTVKTSSNKYYYNIKCSSNNLRLVANSLASPKGIRVINAENLELISERISLATPIYNTSMSPNRKWMITNGYNALTIWNMSNFTKHDLIKDPSGKDSAIVYNAAFVNDSEIVFNSGLSINKLNLYKYSIPSKKVNKKLKSNAFSMKSGFHNGEFYFIDYSSLHIMNLKTGQEEKYSGMFTIAASPLYDIINYTDSLVFVPGAGKFTVVNRKSKKVVYTGESWIPTAKVALSPDNKYLFTSSQVKKTKTINGYDVEMDVNAIVKIDLSSGEIKTSYAETYYPYDFQINSKENTIGIWYVKFEIGKNDSLKEAIYSLYDLDDGKELYNYTIEKSPQIITGHYKSPNGSYFVLDDINGNYLKVFNKDGSLNIDLSNLYLFNPTMYFDEEESKLIITSSLNSQMFFIDLKNSKVIGQLVNADNDQYFLITSDLHYLGSKEFIKNIRFKYNDEIYSFEQFDAYLNQPHTVLRSFACSDSTMIQAYETAYNKRMRLLRLKSKFFPKISKLPSFNHVNMKQLTKSKVSFDIKSSLGKSKLKSLVVYNNGNVVYTKELDGSNQNLFSETLEFETSSGINRFEFVLTDEDGLESAHITRYFNNVDTQKPNLYMVVIASEKFKNNKFDLAYAEKDANDIANTMINSKSFNKVILKKVFNNAFSVDSMTAIKSFFSGAGVNDVAMVFFAGHGYLDDDLSYYFPTYYTDFNDPKINSVAFESFQKMFREMKSLKKLMFIDACFSGEVDEEDFYEEEGEGTQKDQRAATTGMTSFKQSTALEVTKSVFSDLRQTGGVTVISSAGGTEAAFEGEKWNNGLFTYCLLQALKHTKADINMDKKIMLSELQKFVAEEVYKLSDGKQSPTYRMENTAIDYELWTY